MTRKIAIGFLTFILFCNFRTDALIPSLSIFFTPIISPLADGDIYRISINQSGLFKLDYNFIKTELGYTNIDNIDPRNIQIWSTGGGMLEETVIPGCEYSLLESSIFVEGETDGKFDSKDFILFYSDGPDHRYWNKTEEMYLIKKNLYSRTANYYLKFSLSKGQRITSVPFSIIPASDSINQYIDVQHLEDEKINLLAGRTVTYGSGKQWYGDYFKTIRKKDYTSNFNFQGFVPGTTSSLKIGFAARSDESTKAILTLNQSKNNIFLNPTNTGDVEDDIARETQTVFKFVPDGNQTMILDYPATVNTSEGWLNYITVNIWKKLSWSSTPLLISIPVINEKPLAIKVSTASSNVEVWNVTNGMHPISLGNKSADGQSVFFRPAKDLSDQYLIFDKTNNIPAPTKGSKITNQNLASIQGSHGIILYHHSFESAAKKLAQHRNRFSNINTIAIPVDLVFNEFGAGQADPSAIRNFARQQYLNNPQFKYLTLFGDGSYDYLGNNKELKNENLIPVYETDESLAPIFAFPSDDYFGLLEEGEGGSDLLGNLDIAIGRIPVRNKEEADIITDKIIRYDINATVNSDWKLRIAFSADDEDSNVHLNQSEEISKSVEQRFPEFNIQKIYLDAFKQESGAGGEIIPGATQSLNQNIYQGLLVFNYLGHGGPKGLSQEGLLRNSDVESWSNKDKLPLVITATCSFAPYDDPNINSTGEALFRSPYGGAIALLTTVRNVYSSSNQILTQAVFDQLFNKDIKGLPMTLGEVMQRAKNNVGTNSFNLTNARKFALLGDPMQTLAIPRLKISTTQINARAIKANQLDTVRSLQLLTIKGQIINESGQLQSGFNGNISVTLFDKKSIVRTLGQNSNSTPQAFEIRNSILFKGNAIVLQGQYTISFVIPKDIDYAYGPAKLSYFANNTDSTQASGDYENIIIGGSDVNIVDNKGPDVKLYINNFQFQDGGETHSNPILLVDLHDEHGINASGNSIGHDLVAVLDGNKQFVLNGFYESKQGDYKSGLVQYPFTNLSPGLHRIYVKAWDIANNSGEGEINFLVIDPNKKSNIISLTAYPNPTTSQVTVELVHALSTLVNASVKFMIMDNLGRRITSYQTLLTPAAVTSYTFTFPVGSATGVYFIEAEIWNNGKKIDSQGVKVLRIP